MRVLIIDDNALRVLLLKEYLEVYGIGNDQCDSVYKGFERLRVARYDYVFFDCNIQPFEVQAFIVQARQLSPDSMFALTSYDQRIREQYKKLGFDSFFNAIEIKFYLEHELLSNHLSQEFSV